MIWKDYNPKGIFYNVCDDNLKAVCGFFLHTVCGVDLTSVPVILTMEHKLFEHCNIKHSGSIIQGASPEYKLKKIPLVKVVGTSVHAYAGSLLEAFLNLQHIDNYIISSIKSPKQFIKDIRNPSQSDYVILYPNSDKTYFINGNGNHRIICYKLIMLSEIAKKISTGNCWNHHECVSEFSKRLINGDIFIDITKKYWIYAQIPKI
jgi:hypothetical protein